MKLSIRINYILLPVIIAIFTTAGLYAYSNQKALILSAVSEKMKYIGRYIITDVHKNAEELRSLTEVFLNSSEVIHYLNHGFSDVAAMKTESHLIRYLGGFHLSYGELKSVSLVNENNDFIFHYDTTDPFAVPGMDEIAAHQLAISHQLKKSGSTYLNPASYMLKKDANGEITVIVFRTFSPEHLISDSTFSESMRFVTAITETTLNVHERYEKHLQFSFDKGIQVSIEPVSRVMQISDELMINKVNEVESALNIYSGSQLVRLSFSLPDTYLNSLLKPYQRAISGLVFGISFVTFFVLKLLIQKQIISPVVSLTKLVEGARKGEVTELSSINRKDEIALLNNNYVLLFDELNKMAKFDNLTGLSNRVLFNSSLKRVVSHSVRNNSRSALLFIDLDNFKFVNDNYGHHTGDMLLKAFSQRLKDIFSEGNISGLEKSDCEIARLAGDEFAVLLTDVSNNDAVAFAAKRITELCAMGFKLDQQHFDINVSIGIAMCPDDSEMPDELLKNADSAMYQVKRSGKNGYQFYSKELDEQISQHTKIESQLKRALLEEAFYLVWMPVYDCRSGKITGAEALLRTRLVDLNAVGPAEFIPVAETTGLIKDIDYWVVESAIVKLKELIEKYDFSGVLAVNFSAWELQNQYFSQDVAQLLKKHDVPAEQLELEITETCLVADNCSCTVLDELKQQGVKLALDDFGTGYTAFNQLSVYPVDILKVDRTFINAISENRSENDRPLVDIIVELASFYSLDVIAEGIETKEQLMYVRKLGCDRAQGFYLSKPLQWQEFVQLLEKDGGISSEFELYQDEHRLEFKSMTGSVTLTTSAQIITLVYKGLINNELLDFVVKSLPSCIAHLHEKIWGIIIVSDDTYELSLRTRLKVGELVRLTLENGCIDSAYVVRRPETIFQIAELRGSFGLDEDFSHKAFDTVTEAEHYLNQRIEEAKASERS